LTNDYIYIKLVLEKRKRNKQKERVKKEKGGNTLFFNNLSMVVEEEREIAKTQPLFLFPSRIPLSK